MALVDSVEKFSINLTNGNDTASATLTKGQDTTNCVPFITAQITGSNTTAQSDLYLVDVYFVFDDPDWTVVCETTNNTRTMTVEVTVVEFNTTEATVYPFSYIGEGSEDTWGGPVTLANSFVYSTYRNTDTTTSQTWGTARVALETTERVGIRRASTSQGSIRGHAWVVESDGTSFTVQQAHGWIPTGSSGTDALGATVDEDKSFVLCTYRQTLTYDNRELPYFELTSGGASVGFSKSGSSNDCDFAYQVITFDSAADQFVQRGVYNTGSTPPDTQTLSSPVTTLASAMAHSPLYGGFRNGQSTGTAEIDAGDIHVAMELTADDTLSFDHSSEGGETSINVSWEVIEWENYTAGSTRRVMVVS
jgi:hypothetical protein